MSCRSHAQWLRFAAVATILIVLAPAARLAAEVQKVSTESLIYDLKHPDPLRRQAAAKQLGLAKHLPAIPHLLAMTRDPNAPVRREVEFALENMNDTQTMQGFIDFATDFENDIRARAVSLIVSMHLPRASGIGVALAKINDLIAPSWDQDVKIVVEPDVPVSPAVIQTLQARIADSERGIRQTAIRGLGILRAKTVTADLVRVVHEDRDDGLRFEAVRALRKIGDPSVARNLVPMLNVNSDTVRFEIISTLGSMKYRGAVSELTAIVDQPTKKPTLGQLIALAALADIADPVSLPLFERFKADKNDSIRLYANEGLARTANSGQKTDISAARLTEKNAAVRLAQSFALLRLGQTEYLDELVRGLERQSTRELAKEYLVETRPADRPALFAPRSANSTTRSGLADVMGMMGDPNALPTLQDMTRDSDTDVARAAGRAVRRLGVSASQ